MRAGRLDRRISLQSPTLASNGDPLSITWTTQVNVWAERMDAKGAERAMGSMVQASEATQVYRIRARTDIDPTWRVVDGSELWDVVAASPGARRGVETFLMVRRFDPDDAS